jgi:hypothetical protein
LQPAIFYSSRYEFRYKTGTPVWKLIHCVVEMDAERNGPIRISGYASLGAFKIADSPQTAGGQRRAGSISSKLESGRCFVGPHVS